VTVLNKHYLSFKHFYIFQNLKIEFFFKINKNVDAEDQVNVNLLKIVENVFN
jgi:hypothetical protein